MTLGLQSLPFLGEGVQENVGRRMHCWLEEERQLEALQ